MNMHGEKTPPNYVDELQQRSIAKQNSVLFVLTCHTGITSKVILAKKLSMKNFPVQNKRCCEKSYFQ